MKNIAILAAAAAVMMSGSAFAATQSIPVNGSVAPQCSITSTAGTATVTELADADGKALTNIGALVAAALNATTRTAWCSGATNSVLLERSSLSKGIGSLGEIGTDGFANGVIYDIGVEIGGATRTDVGWAAGQPIDGTSDGPIGPASSVTRFGPTGQGAVVTFVSETGSVSGAIQANPANGPTTAFLTTTAPRLSAGTNYNGTVTLTLTPGV